MKDLLRTYWGWIAFISLSLSLLTSQPVEGQSVTQWVLIRVVLQGIFFGGAVLIGWLVRHLRWVP